MDYEAIRYVKPHWFDWGVFKEHGWLIFFTSGAMYLACFILSAKLIWRIGCRLGYPKTILVVGLAGLIPMVLRAIESLTEQLSSGHYQENTHIPAVITIAVTFGAVFVLWLAIEVWHCQVRR